MERVEFWTYGCKDGKIEICFDKQTKCIEIPVKDLKTMVSWITMDLGTYNPELINILLGKNE